MMVQFVDGFIEFDKPLIALVNGPAIGIATSTLGLCDHVIASESAWFQTPFTQLGQCAEGCSSYTFQRILGPSMANDLIMFNQKFNANEMKAAGLVSHVFSDTEFEEKAFEKANMIASLPPQSLRSSKRITRPPSMVEKLKAINRAERKMLDGRWSSEECLEAVMGFLNRK